MEKPGFVVYLFFMELENLPRADRRSKESPGIFKAWAVKGRLEARGQGNSAQGKFWKSPFVSALVKCYALQYIEYSRSQS